VSVAVVSSTQLRSKAWVAELAASRRSCYHAITKLLLATYLPTYLPTLDKERLMLMPVTAYVQGSTKGLTRFKARAAETGLVR